ncbi:transcriptional repressor general negative regulator of transcription subunit 4 [Lithohypha guttulata]|uniref:transcriptional repressor general negative regulator of transcription subunit 4 n=1 Tax=Lithohypha guttulata TaxID=1690604 RepID=UPI00315CA91C
MSRYQDTVIDDDDESCPLCIEEFDLSDKNFKPCPCGYQICQFCFNSLKNTYEKSTCPNCRRPYDNSTIKYKVPTAEELKLDQLNKNKKLAAAKRRETEKREVETSNRRNLAGVRVKQQNLVYIIGLEPNKKDEATLMETLRTMEFFGQYGEIEKIVVSKPKPGAINQGVGVYVTFKTKQAAADCINAVDGSQNGDKTLRAQYGTTKYCSTYLRGDVCQNKNCSFLHETGEDGHQTSLQNEPIESKTKPIPVRSQPTPQPHATSQAMAHEGSREGATSRQSSHDASALPSTVAWANAPVAKARRASLAASTSTASPQLTQALIVNKKAEPAKQPDPPPQPIPSITTATSLQLSQTPSPVSATKHQTPPSDPLNDILQHLKAAISNDACAFHFDDSSLSEEVRAMVAALPPLIDPYGGAKRRVMQDKRIAARAKEEAEEKQRLEEQAKSAAEDAMDEDITATGSLALGGEPEDMPRSASARGTIGRPSQPTPSNMSVDQLSSLSLGRSMTPQQRQQFAMMSAGGRLPQPATQNTAFELSDFDRRAPQQFSQAQYDQMSSHARHGSRYFNNDAKANSGRFSASQQQQQSLFSSGIQGPPPGLPTAGTPSVSGGGMFAHGQGFTSGFSTSKDSENTRVRSGTNTGHDVKRELLLSLQNTNNPLRSPLTQASAPGALNGMYGQFLGSYQDPNLVKQKRKGGKKQRHANTSSSGGGVEHLAADPSILSARVHQGTTGQGLFGGNQDATNDVNSAKFTEPQSAIHSRVSSFHSLFGPRTSTPKVPPGLERIPSSISRSATPQVPPGFENLHAHPSRTDDVKVKASPKKDVAVMGVMPVVPAVPSLPRSRKSSLRVDQRTEVKRTLDAIAEPTKQQEPIMNETNNEDVVSEEAHVSVPATEATDEEVEEPTPMPSFQAEKEEVIEEEATPTPIVEIKPLEKIDPQSEVAQKKSAQDDSKQQAKTESTEPAKPIEPQDITGNTREPKAAPVLESNDIVETPTVLSRPSTPPPQKQADTKRPTLRTLNITTEMIARSASQSQAPASAMTERSLAFPTLSQIRQSSRQASISVSTNFSRPSTPAISEQLMSHDVSRAGTPPPGGSVVGSAPTRQKTKNQLKKERKEKARKTTEMSETGSINAAPTPPAAEEVGPIVARQKKQKKQKSASVAETVPVKVAIPEPSVDKATTEESKPIEVVNTPKKKKNEKKTAKKESVEPVQPSPKTSTPPPPSPRVERMPEPEPELEPEPPHSYTLRDFYNDAGRIEDKYEGDESDAADAERHKEIQDLLTSSISPLQKLLSEMITSGDLAKDHAFFASPPFTSAAYKLPSDNRKGQAYLDGNGYSPSDVFGMVYLPNKEKRALYNGHAVSVADSGDRKDDLLRRCLITPNGAVLRHLSREEGEKVLDLEERRSLYVEEYGDLGRMDGLDRLEPEDFINLEGGFDELSRFGDRHGVCWVVNDAERANAARRTGYGVRTSDGNGLEDDYGLGEMPVDAHEFDDQFDDPEDDDDDDDDDDEELEGEEMVLEADGADEVEYITDDDLVFDNVRGSFQNLPPLPDVMNISMPGSWDPAFNTATYPVRVTPHQAAQHHSMYSSLGPAYTTDIDLPPPPPPPTNAVQAARNPNTLPPIRHPYTQGSRDSSINLRAMTAEQLDKRAREKAREIEASRKEMEKAEKMLNKKSKDAGKWRDGVFKLVSA